MDGIWIYLQHSAELLIAFFYACNIRLDQIYRGESFTVQTFCNLFKGDIKQAWKLV
jgi:hypothetical protein